jgi:hypothetical protein
MQKQFVLCSPIILQYKTCQINLTATKLRKDNYPSKLHTLKKEMTINDFFLRPGPNVPYGPMGTNDRANQANEIHWRGD